MKYIVVIISFILGGLGAWGIQNYGDRLGIIDVPNERSSHTEVVPKGGGIGILAAFVFCTLIFGLSVTFWLSALALSFVSFFGDKVEISAKFRLVVQFVCSFIFLTGFFYSNGSHFYDFLLILPLSVFIVGTANFYNFMDGINGIAGITGAIGFLLLAIWGYNTGADVTLVNVCLGVGFACLGFLPFNVPKAKVFMGDVASVLLGYVFACIVVILSKSFLDFICLSGFLFTFYSDELITMVVRLHNGDSLGKPHRKHIYQLLANEYGLDHWKVSVGYGVVQILIGMMIFYLRDKGVVSVLAFYGVCFLSVCLFSVYIRQRLGVGNRVYHEEQVSEE